MGEVDHRQHAEDQRKAYGKQRIYRAERDPGHQLHGKQLGCYFTHESSPRTYYGYQVVTLWPNSSHVRSSCSFGFSIASTLNTSFLSFMFLDFDSTMITDCTDWWSHLR